MNAATPIKVQSPRPGDEVEVEISKTVKMRFCWIPSGKAVLGSSRTEKNRLPDEAEHDYTGQGLWMGKFPVTQEEWQAVMGSNPSAFSKCGKEFEKVAGMDTTLFPVECVSWLDCQEFVKKLQDSAKLPPHFSGWRFTLPNEDEWEFACRGGTGNKKPFYFGNELDGTLANCNGNNPYGTAVTGPSLGRPTPVGSYEKLAPHPWGLCDMLGNMCQWCSNWSNSTNDVRAIRGGSWCSHCKACRCAFRASSGPEERYDNTGLRIIIVP